MGRCVPADCLLRHLPSPTGLQSAERHHLLRVINGGAGKQWEGLGARIPHRRDVEGQAWLGAYWPVGVDVSPLGTRNTGSLVQVWGIYLQRFAWGPGSIQDSGVGLGHGHEQHVQKCH